MARFPQGAPIRLTTVIRDVDGVIADPTSITLVVRKPDSTTIAPYTPTRDSVGHYHQDVPTADITAIGRYSYAWTTTGVAAGVAADVFDVFDPLEIRVISMGDAKQFLNISTVTTYDSELQSWIDTIDEVIEKALAGPILNRSITERVMATHGGTELTVRQRPLVSVTSIRDVNTGTLLDITDIDVDTDHGIIRRKLRLPWLGRGIDYTLVYVAGWGTSVPSPFQDAAKIILEHFWKVQHGPSVRPSMAGDDLTPLPGSGYSVPNRAAELLSGYTSEAWV